MIDKLDFTTMNANTNKLIARVNEVIALVNEKFPDVVEEVKEETKTRGKK